jgi:trimethylamine--corrinoid protein Co-methyltransferase
VLFVMAALARRLGVPFRSGGNLTAAKTPDFQSAYESAATFFPTILAGVNFVLHTAGWLEGGLVMGYEKFVLDADQASMAKPLIAGVDLTENGQALDALLENPPGQHFLGNAHTLANFETAFWRSSMADNSSFEQWQEAGSNEAVARAHDSWKRTLAEYEAPALDEAIEAELDEWVDRRKASFPDSDV